jgi:hypothetical protein
MNIEDYVETKPRFDFQEFFSGELKAWGVVQKRNGDVIRHFYADLEGSWAGDQGTLHEVFYFSDGEEQTRVWKFEILDGNRITGTAGDVVGTAEGAVAGHAFNMNYVLTVNVDGRDIDVSMDDWMFLIDGKTIINRTTMKKFGFRVGEVLLTIKKV